MKREFNKYLKSLTDKELIQEINKLYNKFESVKQFYEIELGENTDKVLSDFKEKIKNEYFPKRGYGKARNSVSRKIVSEFKKISVHNKDIIELLLFRVEMMIDFSLQYGDIDEAFYNSLENCFEQACKLIKKEKLESYFRNYCQELISKTYNFGWGIHYNLVHQYKNYIDG